ncbi:hypothetical protein CFP65_1444 [Kitasatospora sp. MMS16-BH015]|uniref:DUF4082 domain-containing protein n=1 Tax=Kitasatospora sp. MMS16-BH015 TaxID=2018025 RepID=UPI000CA334BC|nr:DUF4082 domain-containing protein [Kitasatospora sp. MMS16-BH015]AUG76342.1 hypothetical protein CFP65_1444 [Kitasatospora sp. MMS16-BH015]
MRARTSAALATALLGLVATACTSVGPVPHPPPPGEGAGGAPTTMYGAAEPLTAAFPDPAATTLGVRFTSTLPGVVSAVRFFKGTGNTGTHLGALWDTEGHQLARATFKDETAAGWQQAELDHPVKIQPGVTYLASYLAPAGHYAATQNAFDGGPVVYGSGPLTAVGGGFATGATQAFPGGRQGNSEYFVDVVFTADRATGHLPSPAAPQYWAKWPTTKAWSDQDRLPIGVWMQDPTTPAPNSQQGPDEAHAFRALGVNTLVGLWDWPIDDHAQVKAAEAAGLAVVAGGKACDPAPTGGWPCTTADLPLAAQAARVGAGGLAGYLLADEPDLNAPNGSAQGAGCLPPEKLTAFADSLHRQDPGRPVLVNFGSGVGGGFKGPGCPADFSQYTAPVDIVSVDFYGITDPYSPGPSKGVRSYGRVAARTRMVAPGKPVWVFLETPVQMLAASRTAAGTPAASPAQVRAAAWAALVNGATGLEWFCHSFAAGGAPVVDACLKDPASAGAITSVDEEAQRYAAYWNAPPVAVGVTTEGAPVTATLRTAHGRTALLAVATDAAALPTGGPAKATFTLPGGYTGTLRTEDGRELRAKNGKFTDTFTAYQPHVYTLDARLG